MRLRNVIILLSILIFSFPFAALAVGAEVYVVATDNMSRNNYMLSNGDGTFSSQQYMGGPSNYCCCYGNGIGDFDNDGDFDYIQGVGYGSYPKKIYLYEKLGPENNFAPPVEVGAWSEGMYPMNIAVGDFNEDGDLDFILTHYGSFHSELYLGNGDLSFSSAVILENTTPYYSISADTADLNNDGHVDFISADYSGSTLYINLGNGDGTFATSTHTQNSAYWSITAADFDGDGKVDLLGCRYYASNLDFYKGNGDGTFTLNEILNVNVNSGTSSIDNYDFDGDGDQDFVAGRDIYVDVYWNNGSASFSFANTYNGGSGFYRQSISAPPYTQNVTPVAIAEPLYQEVTAGDAAVFDGRGSYDDDGTIVSYVWDFGDSIEPVDNPAPSHVYHTVGVYTVTLTATDDKGATDSTQVQVSVAAVPASVEFMPKTLNLKSKGNWISADISLPQGYDVSQIDLETVGIKAGDSGLILAVNDPKYGFVSNLERGKRGNDVLRVKFDRTAVAEAVPAPADETTLYVVGKVFYNGDLIDFSGFGTIRTIMNGSKK